MNGNEKLKQTSGMLIDVLQKMINSQKVGGNLPQLPVELPLLFENLKKPGFTIVVSGEVNRGKSTLINAIIGRDILPTFDKETTSQVFKIKNSENESFRVVYENGDVKTINQSELIEYGTQVDKYESNNSDSKRISYIEVCVPIVNLPKGVTIVDTPGIGSTFKQHTEIAKMFMQQADAIIYLCSAKHPIVKVDIDFIKNVILPIKTNPSVMFVMSKADQADNEDALANLISRAKKQLQENFAENKTIGKEIIPIDSISLRDSNNETERDVKEVLRLASNYEEVNRAINTLMDKQKFVWLLSAYNCAAQYYKKVNAFLEKQISDYNLNEVERKAKLEDVTKRIEEFESEYGLKPQRKILETINNILSTMRESLKDMFASSGSPLLKKYNEKVERIASRASEEELNEIAQELSEQICEEAVEEWEKIIGLAIGRIDAELRKYSDKCEMQVDLEFPSNTMDTNVDVDMDLTLKDRIQSMRSEFFNGGFIVFGSQLVLNGLASAGVSAAASALTGIAALSGPAGWLVGGGFALAYGLFYGNRKAKEKAVKKAKGQIKDSLSEILSNIYKNMTKTSLEDGKYESWMEMMGAVVRNNSEETITTIYANAKKELEISRKGLLEAANPTERTKVVNQQTLWNTYALSLKKLKSEMVEISHTIKD